MYHRIRDEENQNQRLMYEEQRIQDPVTLEWYFKSDRMSEQQKKEIRKKIKEDEYNQKKKDEEDKRKSEQAAAKALEDEERRKFYETPEGRAIISGNMIENQI
jgi:hypothetical protein